MTDVKHSECDLRTSASRLRRRRLEEELADWAAMTESVGVMKNAARTAVFEEMKAYNREARIFERSIWQRVESTKFFL